MNRQTLFIDILDELERTPTIDTHEHLPPENLCLTRRRDFFGLFKNYCRGELISAGASDEDMAFFDDGAQPLEKRWARFRPFLSRIRTGAYARSALLVVRDVLGFDDLSDDTYAAVSAKLLEMGKPGLYEDILLKRCGLVACIQCWASELGPYPDCFYHLVPGFQVADITSQGNIDSLSKKHNHSIHTLRDLLECMTKTVEQWRADPKVVGIKLGHAYYRSLEFKKTTMHEAETVFNRILSCNKHALATHEAIPLLDFLMFELTARAEAVKLPMVFHTGLQAGNYGRISDANPLLLQSLLEEFPRARFDIFHGGMPWVRETAVLAKYFPGVHLNMAWMHIISPAQARAALSEWLDMVPNNKIFGFGGDYDIVEKIYGHLTIARRNIAEVLADKVASCAMSRAEAGAVIHRLMYDNPMEFYKLDGVK